MAPTRQTNHSKHRKPVSTSSKVHSGRIGRAEPTRSYANRNKGKELIPPNLNAKKELFPSSRNFATELLPELQPPVVRSSLDVQARSRTLKPITNHPRRAKPRAVAAVQAANLRQRRAKQIQDGTTKRLQAMQFDPEYVVEDARFTSTIPYQSARLDLQVSGLASQRRKLDFAIAVGFWGFAPTFTPVKIFSLPLERLANPKDLATLILANTDVKRAIGQIGIEINKVTFVGYEVQFPKGYRYVDYTEIDILGLPRENNTSFKVVKSGERVLINTACAMGEFFWQAEHYASDENGRVLIQVVGRIGKTTDNGYENFDPNWRNDIEKELAFDEKRRYLEQQSFVNGTERKTLTEKMRAIEERSRLAVQNAQLQKQQMEELLAGHERTTSNVVANLGHQAHDINITREEGDSDEIDLNLDLDLDLDINFI